MAAFKYPQAEETQDAPAPQRSSLLIGIMAEQESLAERQRIVKPEAKRIPSLDGLRAISIIMVLLGHAQGSFPWHGHFATVILPYVTNSELGVTTFFVISGYLITYLLKREQEKQGTINIPAFYRRRVLRIFPAFYAYLAVITILSVLKIIPLHLDNIITAGTFLWNYGHYWLHDGNRYCWYIGHFWTLSLEEQFYLLWPAALALLRPKNAMVLALTLIVLMPPIRVATYFLDPSSRGQVGMMLHTAADALMFGCVLALGEGTPTFEKLWKHFQHWLIPLVVALFVLVVWPCISVHHRHLSAPFGMTFNGVSLAIVLLWLVRNPQSMVGKFLNSPGLVFIGVLSYSLYLWQQLILGPVNGTWTHLFPINLILCFALGTTSYYVIEKPFLALRHRKPKFAFVAADTCTTSNH